MENIISHVHILYILRKLTTIQAKSQTNPQKKQTEFKTHFQEKIHYTDPLQIGEAKKQLFSCLLLTVGVTLQLYTEIQRQQNGI